MVVECSISKTRDYAENLIRDTNNLKIGISIKQSENLKNMKKRLDIQSVLFSTILIGLTDGLVDIWISQVVLLFINRLTITLVLL